MGDQIDSHGPSQYCDLEQTIMSPVFLPLLANITRRVYFRVSHVDRFGRENDNANHRLGTQTCYEAR